MRLLCAALAALALIAPTHASAQQQQTSGRDCFVTTNWRGWSAPRDTTGVLYLRVQGDDIYRVDLTPGARVRRNSGEFLVNEVRGSGWICSALNLDLALMDYNGFSRPLIATGLRKLTAEEVAAIPREDWPY